MSAAVIAFPKDRARPRAYDPLARDRISRTPASPPPELDALLAKHKDAMLLAVHDGRDRVGSILDLGDRTRRSGQCQCVAFDAGGNCLGTYPDRRSAMRAVPRSGEASG